jgi:uncharacterized integral membrane protein (TIGR00698 family)
MSMVKLLPGVAVVLAVTLLAYVVSNLPFAPFTLASGTHPLEAMAAGLLIGIIIASFTRFPAALMHGIEFSMHTLLAVGIVLLGFKLDIHRILSMPVVVLFVIVLTSLAAFGTAILVGKLTRHDSTTSLFIGVGNAICGSSAILAAAGALPNADKNHTGMAITTVNLLGLVLVFLLPALGHFFSMSDMEMGLWAGATGQAVPQAIATGFAYSAQAGVYATAIKLTRVIQLGIYVFLIKLFAHRNNRGAGMYQVSGWKKVFSFVPPFILLFIGVVIFNSYVTIPALQVGELRLEVTSALGTVSAFLLSMALSAIGLKTHLKMLIRYGGKNLLIGGLSTLAAVFVSFIGCLFV